MTTSIKKLIRYPFNKLGYDISRINGTRDRQVSGHARLCEEYTKKLQQLKIDKAHYGSGPPPNGRVLGDGWLNIDLGGTAFAEPTTAYVPVDLASKHPFPSDCFSFSFAEDFLEHLDQSQSMTFLSEAFRTLCSGGVLRLSFPGLRGVLRRHYRSSGYDGARVGQEEAYTMWGHKHFYCEESLLIVARHLGFSKVEYVEHGKSQYKELVNLDARLDQRDLNIYVELTK